MNKLKEFTEEEILEEYKLKKLIRYNHRNRICDESVAEHSFFVSLFCLKIMSELELDKNTERKVLVMATLHDLPETVTSDIPHDVKERFPEFDKILKKIEDNYYMENYPKYYYDMCTKNDLVIGILRLADAYSVKQFCLNEMELGNNSTSINKILSDVEARISKQTIYLNILYEEYKEDAKNAQEQ